MGVKHKPILILADAAPTRQAVTKGPVMVFSPFFSPPYGCFCKNKKSQNVLLIFLDNDQEYCNHDHREHTFEDPLYP